MLFRLAADLLVGIHFLFIIFVVAGGFLAWRWRWMAWVHLPAAAWGAIIEFLDWICPLTPLEHEFRRRAGGAGYEGGFIEHYLIPIIYPSGLTTRIRIVLGVLVLVLNAIVYRIYFTRRRRELAGGHPTRPAS